jgi:23S rRNA maturation mini-RNase III
MAGHESKNNARQRAHDYARALKMLRERHREEFNQLYERLRNSRQKPIEERDADIGSGS